MVCLYSVSLGGYFPLLPSFSFQSDFSFPKHSNVYLYLILGQNQALAKASSADRERLKRHACEIHTNGELGQFMTSMVNNVKYMELLCHLNSRGNL